MARVGSRADRQGALSRLAALTRAAVTGLAAALGTAAVSIAAAAPPLAYTDLFSTRVSGCHPLDLTTWSHPTRQVMLANDVALEHVDLCNADKYPVFTVRFKYDPRAQTSSYFHRLYASMAKANGYFPFSFVDSADGVIVDVGVDPRHALAISYEDYAPGP